MRAPGPGTYAIRAFAEKLSVDPVIYGAQECPTLTPGTPAIVDCDRASNRAGFPIAEQLEEPMAGGQSLFFFVDDRAFFSGYVGSNYRIEVRQIVAESEPNDTPATADARQCGIQQDFTPIGDVDFFTLGTPATNGRLFAFVDGSATISVPTDLRVTTATDTLEYDRANSSAPFNPSMPSIAGTFLSATPSFLRVSRDEADQVIGPYRLYSVVQPSTASAITESEPNGTIALADEGVNNYFSGILSGPPPSHDIDIYQTSVAAGDELFVSLDADPFHNNSPIDAKLALLDGAGNVLVQVNDSASTSSVVSGAGSLTATTPFSPSEGLVYRFAQGGTAYVRVEIGTSSATSIGIGDYLLSITRNCVAGGGAFLVDGFESADTTSWSATVPPP